ncbi:MAG: hypothetical protein V7785_08650 [Bermanella sp.]
MSLHIFVVAVLIEAGKAAEAKAENNIWLDSAEFISWNNPDIYEAQAYYYRALALTGRELGSRLNLSDASPEKQQLQTSLNYWWQAQKVSPLWPYYKVGALDIELLLNRPAAVIQKRIAEILTLAPNERGLDKSLLKLSFSGWKKLSDEQKTFMLERLQHRNRKLLKPIFKVAKAAGNHHAICVNLPWNRVRKLCK